jgi:hypothetical protein
MMLLALAVLTAAPPHHQPSVYSLRPEAFADTARADLDTLEHLVEGMHSVMALVEANHALFEAKNAQVYSPEAKQALLSTWGALFAYFSTTEGLRQKYWSFIALSPTDVRHSWGFIITHTALTALLANGLAFANLTLNNTQLETIFDEANEEYGVPRGAFGQFKLKAIHVSTSTQLITGDSWGASVLPKLKASKSLRADEVKWALAAMKENSSRARAALLRSGVKLFALNASDLLKDSTAQAVFPVQKTFAEWAGDTRVARNGRPILTAADIKAMVLPVLQPGDVLVVRQNWFLSNIALPGFWPHAALHVGTAAQLAAFFDDDPNVQAWAASQPEKANKFSELLAARYPAKWKAYATEPDFLGHAPVRVIEAISEGVSFTASEHAFGVDYLAAMRPRLEKVDKAKAIERAFNYQGRPYDFNFDFFSDSSLVCTELVYKAYLPASEQRGLVLGLVDVAGRRTLPANEIVKRFDLEADDPARRQLDFVVFIDAHEKTDAAFVSDEAAFRRSWKRLKWDVVQN